MRLKDASPELDRWPTAREVLDHLARLTPEDRLEFVGLMIDTQRQLLRLQFGPDPEPPARHGVALNEPPHRDGWHCTGCGWRFSVAVTRTRAWEVWAEDERHVSLPVGDDDMADTVERYFGALLS